MKEVAFFFGAIGALQLADSYFQRVWGPDRPAEPRRLPRR